MARDSKGHQPRTNRPPRTNILEIFTAIFWRKYLISIFCQLSIHYIEDIQILQSDLPSLQILRNLLHLLIIFLLLLFIMLLLLLIMLLLLCSSFRNHSIPHFLPTVSGACHCICNGFANVFLLLHCICISNGFAMYGPGRVGLMD